MITVYKKLITIIIFLIIFLPLKVDPAINLHLDLLKLESDAFKLDEIIRTSYINETIYFSAIELDSTINEKNQYEYTDDEIKSELDQSIESVKTVAKQNLDRINSEVANRLDDGHKESILELEKIVGVQKGLLSIYSKGLKAALTRYNEFSSEFLDELKDQLNISCQQITNETNQTISEFDVDTFLQILEDKIKNTLTELGNRIISRSTEEFMRTLENLGEITHKTSKTVSTTAESFKNIFTRVSEDVSTNLSDIENEFQEVKTHLLDIVSTSLLAQRNEFAQLAQGIRGRSQA